MLYLVEGNGCAILINAENSKEAVRKTLAISHDDRKIVMSRWEEGIEVFTIQNGHRLKVVEQKSMNDAIKVLSQLHALELQPAVSVLFGNS